MTRTSVRLSVCLLLICCVLPLTAQRAASADSVVPAVVKFTGTLSDVEGKPLAGTVGVTFMLYKEQTGGAPLWIETQNVQADKNGHYSVMLGSATSHGLPLEVFVAGEARWLGVQPSGQAEQPRTLLLSVPYALKALDAETLGGRPASAFMSAPSSGAATGTGPRKEGPQAEQKNEIVCSSATNCKTGFVPLFSTNGGSAQVTDSIVSQSGTNIAIAGSQSVKSAASTPAILGKSTGTSGTSNGVQGVTSSGTAAGVAGVNSGSGFGVYGFSSFGDGVYGQTSGVTAYGVAGVNTATGGIGVLGSAPNGDGFYTVNNVYQDRSAGGWVKAMAFVSPNGIVTCFNSTLIGAPATVPPCGFIFDKTGTGDYIINFGFQVDDRFFSVNLASAFGGGQTHPFPWLLFYCTDKAGACKNTTDSFSAEFSVIDTNQNYQDALFNVIIY